MELNINGELAQRANPVKKGAATQNIGADDKLKIQKKDAVVESKTELQARRRGDMMEPRHYREQ